MGHALLRRVKVLTDENEDLGRQQRESKQAAQVRGHGLVLMFLGRWWLLCMVFGVLGPNRPGWAVFVPALP